MHSKKSEQSQDEAQKKPLTTIKNIPSKPSLLAWSSQKTNNISIVELETKQKIANFDGVKLNKTGDYSTWTHVKEIINTRTLVSVHQRWDGSANLEVFDVLREGQIKKVYSFEEVLGMVGYGEVAYNPRRNVLGAMCVKGKIAYHLYNFASSKDGSIVKLIRKSKWHDQNTKREDNVITSLDFNPTGETAATLDYFGRCLISNVNTNKCSFHLDMNKMSSNMDAWGRCRWSSFPGEPLLFVKHQANKLNILDVEKKTILTLNSPMEVNNNLAFWIDVCPRNGNLMAIGGRDQDVKIFDKRRSKMVNSFSRIHKDWINCVRWSASGDMLASASNDKTVALLDFKTGKNLYSEATSDGSFAMSVCFI